MNNGWDGVSAMGKGSTLEVSESESLNNFEHGIETWDGAACILTNNRCEGNSRNGIHADNGMASATISDNQLVANREFGLVLDSAKAGKISGNTAKSNLLGGFVIRAAAAGLPFGSNTATRNEGPGLVLEKGLPPAAYAANSITENAGVQIMAGIDLSEQAGIPDAAPAKIPKAIIVPEPDLPVPPPH
jgi:parallel beta-helix repeat protein